MNKERKIAMVVRKVSLAQAEEDDIVYWANASIEERLTEMNRLRRMIYAKPGQPFPDKMELVGRVIKKSEADKEDGSF
jgi:DNA topoisomerase IB